MIFYRYTWYSATGDPFQNACALLSKCVDREEVSSTIIFFTYSGFVSNHALVFFSHQVSDASIKSGRAICNNFIRYQLWIWKIKLHTPVNGLTIDDVTNFLYKFRQSWPILFSRFPCCVLCHGTQMKIQVQIRSRVIN